jgi:hypothetical protein
VTVSRDLPRLDPNTPTPARIYDYLLGGNHNFAVDREAAQQMIAAFPPLPQVLAAARAFVRRAVRYLAEDRGITQFLDLGSGIPTVRNVHEIAQGASSAARVTYVDIDPVAVAHARTILRGTRNVTCTQGDIRDSAAVLADPAIRSNLSFAQPVAIVLNAVLHFIPGDDVAAKIVEGFTAGAAPGSYLVLLHHTSESDHADEAKAREIYNTAVQPLIPRSRAQITAFFAGLELVDPGVVLSPLWRPDPTDCPLTAGDTPQYFGYAGVARKP